MLNNTFNGTFKKKVIPNEMFDITLIYLKTDCDYYLNYCISLFLKLNV